MNANNRRRVNYQARFDQYLNQYRRRSRSRNTAITIGAIVFAAVAISLFTAVFAETLSYSKYLYYPARLLLVITLLCLLVTLFWKPRRTLNENDGATQIEATVPAFDGRVETYIDLKRREDNSPFVSLLAKDASKTAAKTPIKTLLPTSEIVGPLFASAGMLALAAWLFTALPGEWRAGLQHLWIGWYKTDILPERSLAVTPGDTKIRLGDSLIVEAGTTGFESDLAQLHIKKRSSNTPENRGSDQPVANQTAEWEVVEMNRQQSGKFSFTLYGVSDPIEYFVSSAFVKSEPFSVDVVIPPNVENIQLTYTFPSWTGREPYVIADGGEVAAVEGTMVELLIETDKPLQHGELLLDEAASNLTPVTSTTYTANFTVGNKDGEYQLAELLGDDRIMLTPLYKIIVTEDAEPTISFSKPGGDWSATSIEEVTVAATAADDFEIKEVILHYSVNGGDWAAQSLDDSDGYQHTFMLEEFKNELGEALLPGDLVTYYAEAKDREQTVSTDIQFIDVKPFERRFTQSQQSGQGGGGGQQEPPPGEISQRQKEILVATWNLIRDQQKTAVTGTGGSNATGSGGGGSIGISGNGLRHRGIGFMLPRRQASASDSIARENAELLAELQNTLADQAETLAQRAEARQLLNNDPKVAQFVEYIRKAAQAMRPSAEQLSTQSLQEAVQHQQQALQFLRRGELLFNDITINQNQGNGNSSGNNAGRDMAEIYELEMDLAKNQYETPDSAPQGGSADQTQDDAFDKLKELARRQQELAESTAEKNELTSADRWEQEKLRRELEELKRELEQLQREQTGSDQQSQQSQSQSGQSESQQGESQQSESQQSDSESQSQSQAQSGGSGGGQSESSETQQALQNLEQALRELEDADQNSSSAEEQSQAMQAASERLQQSLENIEQARQQRLQSQLADASDQVRDLMRQQTETAQELRDALQRSIDARVQNTFDNGLTPMRSEELADQKRAMQRQLEAVQQDIADAIKRFEEQAPQTTERLQQALDELDRNKAAELMGISGDMIDDGMAPQASLREPRITEALRNLQNDLSDASALASDEAQQPTEQTITAADATRSLRESRQALTEALNRARGDQANSNRGLQTLDASRAGPEESQTGQQNNSQQGGEQEGNAQQSDSQQQGQSGQSAGTSSSTQSASAGIVRNSNQQMSDTQLIQQATDELEQLGSGDIEGLSQATVEEFTDLARRLRATSSVENDRRIDAEVRLLLRQLEQLELKVYNESQGISGVRTGKRSETPEGYDRRSADYFRRLSEGEKTSNGS